MRIVATSGVYFNEPCATRNKNAYRERAKTTSPQLCFFAICIRWRQRCVLKSYWSIRLRYSHDIHKKHAVRTVVRVTRMMSKDHYALKLMLRRQRSQRYQSHFGSAYEYCQPVAKQFRHISFSYPMMLLPVKDNCLISSIFFDLRDFDLQLLQNSWYLQLLTFKADILHKLQTL